MVRLTLHLAVLSVASLTIAAQDPWARLTKPALHPDLDYLKAGLTASLPKKAYTYEKWDQGWIPQDCYDIARDQKVSPRHFEVYNVKYQDCGDGWIMCYHRDSEISLDSLATQFGRLPLQMRSWVKHVITIAAPPEGNSWAFETGGNTVYVKPGDDMLTVFLHETGHSLDLNGAYGARGPGDGGDPSAGPLQLSDSVAWWGNLSADGAVPDRYAQTNALEDVAQNTVVAAFDLNVPGGFAALEPGWVAVAGQVGTVQAHARAAGRAVGADSLLMPGGGGDGGARCTHRIPNSEPTSVYALPGRLRRAVGPAGEGGGVLAPPPDVRLSVDVERIIIPVGRTQMKPGDCQITW